MSAHRSQQRRRGSAVVVEIGVPMVSFVRGVAGEVRGDEAITAWLGNDFCLLRRQLLAGVGRGEAAE